MPKVSVVIPAFNAAAFVAEAVGSVLSQTFRDLEIIVVDDGSTDDTLARVATFSGSVRAIHQVNSGVAAARNRGIGEAAGNYVAFLDADDTWKPEKLERQLGALRATKGARASATAFEVTNERGHVVEVRGGGSEGPVLRALLLAGNVVGTPSSVVAERSLLAEVGGFDSRLSQCADWELWIRFSLRTEFAWVSEPLVRYRQHAGNMSGSIPLLEKDSRRTLELAFTREGLPSGLRAAKRQSFGRNYAVLAGSYFRAGMLKDALRCGFLAMLLAPRQLRYIAAFPLRALKRRRRG